MKRVSIAVAVAIAACGHARDPAAPPARPPAVADAAAPPVVDAAPVAAAGPRCRDATASIVPIAACEQQCAAGDAEACAAAAKKYWGGVGVKADMHRCLELARRGCDLGSARGCSMAASVYSGFHDDKLADHAQQEAFERKAFPKFEADCAAGIASACDTVAWWSGHGMGTAKWLAPDADRLAKAHARYGELAHAQCEGSGDDPEDTCGALALDVSVGEAKNPKEAARLYKRGCDRGFPEDCLSLARERSDANDDAGADTLRKRACDLGLGHGCYELGFLGRGERDKPALYKRACDLGDASGCNLGEDFARGCALGDDYACGELAKLRAP